MVQSLRLRFTQPYFPGRNVRPGVELPFTFREIDQKVHFENQSYNNPKFQSLQNKAQSSSYDIQITHPLTNSIQYASSSRL
jgi:hypothetical protein